MNQLFGLQHRSRTDPVIIKIKNTGLFKPYAIIDQNMFDAEIQNLRK